MRKVALIDYGAGNLRSAERALLAAGAEAVRVTDKPEDVLAADRIVLPGQGAFAACMAGLRSRPGLVDALDDKVRARGAPFLGICVGMQLLADEGREFTITKGLGWIGGICRELDSKGATLPHMGWNEAALSRPHPVLAPLAAGAHVYFAHSFVLVPRDREDALAWTEHGESFASAVARDNMLGVQFHPEKSQKLGLALLARFLDWKP